MPPGLNNLVVQSGQGKLHRASNHVQQIVYMSEQLPLILLIDDDADDLELLASSLESLHVRTKRFDAAEKAINYLNYCAAEDELPSLVILDYNMPRINGQQLLSAFKSNKILKDIPVVMYSTGMSLILKQALLDMGAYDCFVKPDKFSELTNQVRIFKQIAYSIENVKVYDKVAKDRLDNRKTYNTS